MGGRNTYSITKRYFCSHRLYYRRMNTFTHYFSTLQWMYCRHKCKVPEHVEPGTPRFDHIHRHLTRLTTCLIRQRHRTACSRLFHMGMDCCHPFYHFSWTCSLDCKQVDKFSLYKSVRSRETERSVSWAGPLCHRSAFVFPPIHLICIISVSSSGSRGAIPSGRVPNTHQSATPFPTNLPSLNFKLTA